ncbi:MAG: hypothetical protein ABIS03_06875 [Gemmatimonadaceae bacterium]
MDPSGLVGSRLVTALSLSITIGANAQGGWRARTRPVRGNMRPPGAH